MKLRAIAAAVVAALAATTSACGSAEDTPQDVTMWVYPVVPDEAQHRAFWDEQIEAFTKDHANIDVKVEIYPWAKREESLTTAIAGNKAPDLVYLIPDQIPKFAKLVQPVDQYLPDEVKGDYRDNVRESVTMDGKLMGAPILMGANPLMCNKKVLDAAGVSAPATWDDLLEIAPTLKAKGFDVTNYYADPSATLNQSFYPLLWEAGGDVFDEDGGKVAFDGDAGVRALTFLKTLVDEGYTEKELITGIPAFEQTRLAQGKVACTWQQLPADVESFWGADAITIHPPLKDEEQVGYGSIGALSMMKQSGAKDAAGEWLAFVSSPEVTKAYDLAGNYFSPYQSTGALYTDGPQAEVEKTLDQMVGAPLHDKARDVMGLLAPEIQAALIGQKSPEQALADAAEAANGLIGQ
ncbi:hypothetical protein BLA60_03365 [Actinophytocola xinjiangensis]|uniref:Multiple sugar transport system substrate-binding protein n=1 Tax=Actinophytocola xinjiangensis TaxID=485602 RepID=A0A7Z0WUE1_9PSEU|nr:sugar ABC transporter substrate-binding protein [Actinophytocola xinjiangensis]OLF14196.1 hypothetical protein BLA60_03365 [Actinophytocola xinjiangensis]